MAEIRLEFDHALADRLHVDRVYYAHSAWAKIDKVVAVLLALMGVALIATSSPRWWVFLLVYAKEMYTVLPKGAFKDAAEIDGFRDLVRRKIGTSGSP